MSVLAAADGMSGVPKVDLIPNVMKHIYCCRILIRIHTCVVELLSVVGNS